MQNILKSCEMVAANSRRVRVNPDAAVVFAQTLSDFSSKPAPWDDFCHFSGKPLQTAAWLLVLDTINFCFFAPPGKKRWEIQVQGKVYDGYEALALALKQAMERNSRLIDPGFLSAMTPEILRNILGGTGELLLMDERALALSELGRVLLDQFKGSAEHLILSAKGSAPALANILAVNFTSFQDRAFYNGQAVWFLKRAQIFVSDLFSALGETGLGNLEGVEQLTCFADYKLPQVLRQEGILEYAPGLARRVDAMELLPSGSEEEVEIRANTVWAVEVLVRKLEKLGQKMSAPQVDYALWKMGQDDHYRQKPYHRTVSIFY